MSTSLKIIQPNIITSARYNYSVTEKRVIYHIIKTVQDKMKSGISETLFGDMLLSIPMEALVKHDNYRRVKDNLLSLRRKSFAITTDIDPTGKGEDGFLIIGFINFAEYDSKTGKVEFEVSRKMVPYLLELAKGFTSYTLGVALSLKSEYSQRMYEFCSRFKDTGVWNINIEELRKTLVLEDKYKLYSDFKRKILDRPQKEIKALSDKGDCDLYFVYEEKKTGKRITDLSFRIYSQSKAKAEALKSDDLQYIADMFRNLYANEYEQPFAKSALTQLFDKGVLVKFSKRLKMLEDEVVNGTKKTSDLPPLIRYILKEDYQIS
jgi:plasmid replication initiation protein